MASCIDVVGAYELSSCVHKDWILLSISCFGHSVESVIAVDSCIGPEAFLAKERPVCAAIHILLVKYVHEVKVEGVKVASYSWQNNRA